MATGPPLIVPSKLAGNVVARMKVKQCLRSCECTRSCDACVHEAARAVITTLLSR